MCDSQNLFSGKRKYLWGILLVLFISIVSMAFGIKEKNDFEMARREILLRRIGHEILLQSNDSTSRVLPIKKLSENEYQINFEHAFTFQPEGLVNISRRLLAEEPFASDYIVNVLHCVNASVVYSFAISENKKDDIVSCKGRQQPTSCYTINFKFHPTGIISLNNGYVLGGSTVVVILGFVLLKSDKAHRILIKNQSPTIEGLTTIIQNQSGSMFTLGALSFDSTANKLIMNGKTKDLTGTETRLLRIFALTPNQIIERSQLQKEIWEDQGVIVGRSLDMFISKLRKKLEFDPNIKIVVIRGKGYKLQISSSENLSTLS